MEISIADQIALDDALVAPADRLKIGKCNLRLSSDVTSKEATLQVVYDVLKLTPFYKAFQVTADAPEIYMQEFWATAYVHNRSVRFKMNNKKHILGLDQFRDILQICPKVGNKKFEDPPLEKEILAFLASLGHSGDIRKITDVNVNKLHQPWRSFAAIINKCLSGKPSMTSLVFSAQILWASHAPKEKKEKKSGKGKQKTTELETISEAVLTEAEQLKIITKRSRKETHSSHASGSGVVKGNGVTPRDDEEAQDDEDDDKNDETDEDDSFDPIIHTPSYISSSVEEDSNNEIEGSNVEGAKSDKDGTYEEDQEKFLGGRIKALEDNFSELRQTINMLKRLSSIPGIIGDTVTIKRPRDGADDDQEPSAGIDRGSKRRRSGKDPASTSAPSETTTTTAGKTTTTGSKTHKQSASQSALRLRKTMPKLKMSLKPPAHQSLKQVSMMNKRIRGPSSS
ncbi:hypothetical protein Tco_1362308 [Tanacetum coccineum]